MLPGAALDLPRHVLQDMIARAGASILCTDIRTKVILNGQEFTANIDTGLDDSTINSKAAWDAFGIALEERRSRCSCTLAGPASNGGGQGRHGHGFAPTAPLSRPSPSAVSPWSIRSSVVKAVDMSVRRSAILPT